MKRVAKIKTKKKIEIGLKVSMKSINLMTKEFFISETSFTSKAVLMTMKIKESLFAGLKTM